MKTLEQTIANLDQNVIREKITNGILNIGAIIGILIIVINFFRIDMKEVSTAIHTYSILYLIFLGLTLFKSKFSLNQKSFLLVALPFIGGVVALFNFALIGAGWPFLAMSTILGVILFGYVKGLYLFIFSFCIILFAGWRYCSDEMALFIDLNKYNASTVAWASALVDYVIICIAIISAFYFFRKALLVSVNELKRSNKTLKNEIKIKINELEKEKLRAENLARKDFLTGLNNRRAFFEFGEHINEQAKRYKKEYSIIMIDIDYFKKINDNFGHKIGDIALQGVANSISEIARASDICARIGGEEFAIILPQTNLKNVISLAKRLKNEISNICIKTEDGDVSFTASFGIASFNKTSKTVESVLSHADKALYQAKDDGRNQIIVY